MRSYRQWLLLVWLWGQATFAAALSNAPLEALNSYIENSGNCSRQLVDWNRDYSKSTMTGETSRGFYFRVLGYMDWGACGKPFTRAILSELQKAWNIFAGGRVSEAEYEAKEAELVNLFFAAVADPEHGQQKIDAYEAKTATRLMGQTPPKQYFNCTFFGNRAQCVQ